MTENEKIDLILDLACKNVLEATSQWLGTLLIEDIEKIKEKFNGCLQFHTGKINSGEREERLSRNDLSK